MTSLIQFDLEFMVMHRPDFDSYALADDLRAARSRLGMTLSDVADVVGVTRTEAEHWFRKDRWNAPPSVDVWPRVRDLFRIEGWDVVGDYDLVPNVFETSGRAYHEDGICPTVVANGPPWVVRA